MRKFKWGFSQILLLLFLGFSGVPEAQAQFETPTPIAVPSPYELIQRVNWMRNANGYAALVIDPILMGTAQATAEYMAYNKYYGHYGSTREKLIAAGYGAGDVAWGTENIAWGSNMDLDLVLSEAWNDPLHSIPMVNPNYKHIGAAIVEADGEIFYVLHAGYTSNGIYQPQTFTTPDPNATPDLTGTPATSAVSQLVIAVATARPDADGRVVHVVRSGQTLWSIADAYGMSVADLAAINGLLADNPTIYVGQKLLIRIIDPALVSTTTPLPALQVTATMTPAPTLTGLPAAVVSPTAAISKEVHETRERWWLFGILAAFGAGLLVVTLSSMGSKT